MPRNISGVMLLPASSVNPPVAGTTIVSADFQAEQVDIANEITNSLDRLGRAPMQNDLKMGGFNITGLGALLGSADGSVPGSGQVSENLTYTVASTAVASGVAGTMASLSLPAGRWLVSANCTTIPGGGTSTSSFQFWLSNALAGPAVYSAAYAQTNVPLAAGVIETLNFTSAQVIISGAPFTIYFIVNIVFAGGTMNVSGSGGAIRLL